MNSASRNLRVEGVEGECLAVASNDKLERWLMDGFAHDLQCLLRAAQGLTIDSHDEVAWAQTKVEACQP